jgi:uncharacterized protein
MSAVTAAALVAVAIGAGAQAITGFGFSLVCVPLLTVVLGGGDGVRLANALAIGVNLLLLGLGWRQAEVRRALALLGPAVVVIPLAAVLAAHASPGALSVGAGVLVLVAVGVLAVGFRARRLTGWAGLVLAGALSGAMNVLGGVGGPAVASYTTNAGWTAERLRPTLAAYFLGINVVSVLARGVPPVSAGFLVASSAAGAGGFAVGSRVARRANARTVERATLALAAAGAAGAIISGLR